MSEKKSNTGFLVQGSILAMASLISRIIGLIYRIPLIGIIGDVGMDYYATAFEIYNNLLIISSYSLPLAVSKLVSANLSKGKQKNAFRVLKGAALFATITGGAAALILFFCAELFTEAMQTPFSIFAVKVLVPTLLIVALLGVLRGFFQGLGSMIPSAVSQILEQIVNAIVSVWAAYVLYEQGMKVGAILGNQENYAAAYGAAGGTLGTGAGAFAALLFSAFVLVIYLYALKKRTRNEGIKKVDSYQTIFHTLLITIIPVLLSTTIYNCNTLIDMAIFKNIASSQGYSALEISTWNGVYTGRYKTLINVPISIASAMAASSVPALTAAYTKKNAKEVRSQIGSAIRFIMLIAMPCAVGIGVLAEPILEMLHLNDETGLAAVMLRYGAVSIVFFSLSTLSNGLLQGIDRMKEPVKNAFIALILQIGVLVGLMYGFHMNIYAVIFANAAFGLIMSFLNALSLRRYAKYRQEIVKTFLIPALSSALMGVVVWAVHYALEYILRVNFIATILSIVIGAMVYFSLMLLLKGMGEKELRRLPKGHLLVKLAKRMRLLR